jgi:hypothetical protein
MMALTRIVELLVAQSLSIGDHLINVYYMLQEALFIIRDQLGK